MYPVVFQLGPITIYSFGLMVAAALFAGGLIVSQELRRKGLDPGLGWQITCWAAIGGLVGARLWAMVDDFDRFLEAPVHFLLLGGGVVWYGGLVGGFLGASWVIHQKRLPRLVATDCVAIAIPLAHAIGRIGCQLAGDGDWGATTTLPWGMSYPNAIIGWDYPPGVRVHPAPLYEAALYLGIFGLLWALRRRVERPGTILALYFVLAGTARFLIEYVRIEPRVLWSLTAAQLFSVLLVAVGAVLIYRVTSADGPPRKLTG